MLEFAIIFSIIMALGYYFVIWLEPDRASVRMEPQQPLKVAIAAYPDALILEYGIKHFSNPAFVKSCEIVRQGWGATDSKVEAGAFDVAYMNANEAKSLITLYPHRYVRGPRLLDYFGFSIIAHGSNNIEDFDSILKRKTKNTNPSINDLRDAGKEFCQQLKDHEFVTAINSDQHRSLISFCAINNIYPSIDMSSPDEPNAAYNYFKSNSNSNKLFVGGSTERLIAVNLDNMSLLFGHSQFPEIAQPESNCLVVDKSVSGLAASQTLNSMYIIWSKAVQDIANSETSREVFREFLNEIFQDQLMYRQRGPHSQPVSAIPELISSSDLSEVLTDWFKIPGLKLRKSSERSLKLWQRQRAKDAA